MAPVPHDNDSSTDDFIYEEPFPNEEFRRQAESQPLESIKDRRITPSQQPPASLPLLPPGPGPGHDSSRSTPKALPTTPTIPRIQEDHHFNRDWTRVKRLRKEIWGQRSRVHECRGVLRDKQQVKAAADDQYIQYVRKHGHGIKFETQASLDGQTEIGALYRACVEARDDYGPMEDDCNALESKLSVMEFELDSLERKLYDRSPSAPAPPMVDYDATHHFSSLPSSSSSDSGTEKSRELHPLVLKYLSKLGDLEIFRERLDELLDERYILEEEKEKRARVNLKLSDENEEWLANYSTVEDGLIEQFETAQNEAEKLKQECQSKGLIDGEGEPTAYQDLERQILTEELHDGGGSEISEYAKFPTLLPQPGVRLPLSVPPSVLFAKDVPHISSVRVNWWILDQLRMSALEVGHLARTFESEYGQISETGRRKWEFNVLQLWYKDGAEDEWLAARPSSLVKTMTPHDTGYISSISSAESETGDWNPTAKVSYLHGAASEDGSVDTDLGEPTMRVPRPLRLVKRE
ncbi:hypothetical protein BKA65DRAFT_548481 [Rhexocercosporidium sp. MPI-PUGE-AT-0058]|nr:hypothetical protein BKA65DRAFT_548481 [Rhexocercosporidium sp. MPI-PUGE-AT-0058]